MLVSTPVLSTILHELFFSSPSAIYQLSQTGGAQNTLSCWIYVVIIACFVKRFYFPASSLSHFMRARAETLVKRFPVDKF